MEEIEKKYVVLDVETNGRSSLNDDLLSVSIYKPDDNKMFNRFLPLELAPSVYTTCFNGITKKMLKGATPFSQEEIDKMIEDFELDKRTILTYGDLDERFIKNYLKRKKLKGYEKMNFYNFKHDIISSSFAGNVTKDNLCRIYGIDNVKEVHSGENDCLLEWQLFKKIYGKKLLVTGNNVFELNNDYIIPASYLSRYNNFKYCFDDFPKFEYTVRRVKSFVIKTNRIRKFDTNISGVTIEHLINTMLNVKKIDSLKFLIENKRKLKYIGRLPSIYYEIPTIFNNDGTITAIREEDKEIVKEINKSTEELKKRIAPVIEYIKTSIFKNKEILSQELVISNDKKVLALCDLSNEKSVLEIKTYSLKMEKMKYQLYYESNGRNCYVMTIDWDRTHKKITFIISKVNFKLKEDKTTKKESLITKKNDEITEKKDLSNKKENILTQKEDLSTNKKEKIIKKENTNTKKKDKIIKNESANTKKEDRFTKKEDLSIKKEINKNENIIQPEKNYNDNMKCKYIEFIGFDKSLKALVKLHCKKCNKTWKTTYQYGLEIKECPFCNGKTNHKSNKIKKEN